MTPQKKEMFAVYDSDGDIIEIFYYEDTAARYVEKNYNSALRAVPVLVTPIKPKRSNKKEGK